MNRAVHTVSREEALAFHDTHATEPRPAGRLRAALFALRFQTPRIFSGEPNLYEAAAQDMAAQAQRAGRMACGSDCAVTVDAAPGLLAPDIAISSSTICAECPVTDCVGGGLEAIDTMLAHLPNGEASAVQQAVMSSEPIR